MIYATGRNTGEALSNLNKISATLVVRIHQLGHYGSRYDAETASLAAFANAFDDSPLDPFAVAVAVGKEAALKEQEAAKANRPKKAPKLKTPSLLGCWVNGELKFQTRDHDELHAYAARKMQDFRNNVWVAPVGSFIDAKQQKKLEDAHYARV